MNLSEESVKLEESSKKLNAEIESIQYDLQEVKENQAKILSFFDEDIHKELRHYTLNKLI